MVAPRSHPAEGRRARTLARSEAADAAPWRDQPEASEADPAGFSPPPLAEDPSAGELLRFALAQSLARLLDHEGALLDGDDPHPVHQARVATRRLRSDPATFRRWLDPAWASDLRRDLRTLAFVLGRVRDPDVLHDRLTAGVATLAPADARAAAPVLARLESDREGARATLRALLASDAYAELRTRLIDAAFAPPLAERAGEPAERHASALLERRWKKLARRVERAPRKPNAEILHAIRIDVKHVRYTAQTVAPVLGRRAVRLERALAEAQDVLGVHQDAVSAAQWLREAAQELPRETAFVAGCLAEGALRDAREARALWRPAWKRVTKRRVRGKR